MTTPLAELEVLALDCQATSPSPATGHLLEIGWADVARSEARSRLVQLPEGAEIPRRVARVTGLSEQSVAHGEAPEVAWSRVVTTAKAIAARSGAAACTTIIHFSRFETPYLRWLNDRVDDPAPLHVVCTHAIVTRLLPSLPRRGLRAVAGYFGHVVSELRRASDHVSATVTVWNGLVELLERHASVRTLDELDAWLLASRAPSTAARGYPMPASARRALPNRPGVYRMLGPSGHVLYVGKAASLRQRVASYFQRSASHPEHILEMLTQARDVETTTTRSAVEAALEEADTIKRLAPPYNKALRSRERTVVFASGKLDSVSDAADVRHRLGPLPASELWTALASLDEPKNPAEALAMSDRFAPGDAVFRDGVSLFRGLLGESTLLAHGCALWPEDDDEPEEPFRLRAQHADGAERWTPAGVADRLNEIVRRTAHWVRRGHWLCLLSQSVVSWGGPSGERLGLVIEKACVRPTEESSIVDDVSFAERRRAFDLDAFDRMIVLTKEIRRLLSDGRHVELRIGADAVLSSEKLKAMLRWV